MKMEEKRTILFDLDGTLTDSGLGITKSAQYALEAFGIHTEHLQELCKFVGPPLMDSFMNFYGFSEKDAARAVEKFREYFRETGIYENELYSGIDRLLSGLSAQGRQLIVATSKLKVFAERVLEHFDIAQYFDFVSGSELDGTRSKKGEVIKFAFDTAGIIDPGQVVMVGDREHDILGAREAGIDSIGVLYGYGSREELDKAGATVIVDTVENLGRVLMADFHS